MCVTRIAPIIFVLFVVAGVRAQAPADDRSLPTQAYQDRGVPSPNQPWSGDDFEKLIAELQRVRQTTPDQLPRVESARSGTLFARIIATENFTTLAAKNVNPVERWKVLDPW